MLPNSMPLLDAIQVAPHQGFMENALDHAREAAKRGEVPVGAVLVDPIQNIILSSSGNRTEELNDPTAHAEILVIREATTRIGTSRLDKCNLYVTLEPCAMCAAAISFARLRRLFFGAYDTKGGGIDHGARVFQQSTCHHVPEVYGGINESDAKQILRDFFQALR